ncbi:hypothetical protein GEOBRER4_n1613 [Citrifermentans bremense]|uniref:Uncharacterized protein n=1 Tax=Citrifermentans bremense TaxID=60035 RepID=A0A6S6LZQ2_9BACT|nr:hypothetical protein [Citrifermentans bremense]BCG46799.1 hypothetical protein GEOBRER4_n1613 [Citrifermentans bremense]
MRDEMTEAPEDIHSSLRAIREQKTQLLFRYLKEKFELDRQMRLLNVSEQLANVNRAHEQALNEVFSKEAR